MLKTIITTLVLLSISFVSVLCANDITITSIEITQSICDTNSGSITIHAESSSNLPLEYSLDGVNFQTDSTFINLAPIDYLIYVTDFNCTEIYSVQIAGNAVKVDLGTIYTCIGDTIQELGYPFNTEPISGFGKIQFSTFTADGCDSITCATLVAADDCKHIFGDKFYKESGICETRISPSMQFEIDNGNSVIDYYVPPNQKYDIFLSDKSDYTITPSLKNKDLFSVEPASFQISNNLPDQNDLCISSNEDVVDLEVYMQLATRSKAGCDVTLKVTCVNNGSIPVSSDLILQYENQLMQFVASSSDDPTVDGNKLTWKIDDIKPFERQTFTVTFLLNSPMSTPPLIGDELISYQLSAESISIDINPDDNEFELIHRVTNSFDPNDKTCLEGPTIYQDKIGDYLHYLIRFENVGTAKAENIIIIDSLDQSTFDSSSFEILESSHQLSSTIDKSGVLKFTFKDIFLGFADDNNDGFVSFKLKTLNSLSVHDVINNKAEIYFDQNFPIITNTAQTIILAPSSNRTQFPKSHLKAFPNPFSNTIVLECEEAITEYSISTMHGKTVKQESLNIPVDKITIMTSDLIDGLYLLKVTTNEGELTEVIYKS